MKNPIKLTTSLFMIFLSFTLTAQENEEETKNKFSISGSVDAYYRFNLNGSNNPNDGTTLAPATSFADLPGFSLGMINVIGGYENGKVGAIADLVLGPRGQEAVFGSITNSNIINQLYIYYQMSDRVKFTFGNFNTFLGYEVISPTGNFNYSTSYMFSYGPFSHTGLKVDFDLGSGWSLMTGVFNPTDFTEFNPDGTYVAGAQLGYATNKSSLFLNTLLSDGFSQFDLTAGTSLTDKLYLGLNATLASDNFEGLATYLQFATSDELKLGIRAEYFKDKGIGVLNDQESVFDLTFSANYTIGSLTLIPEIRVDNLSYDGFQTEVLGPNMMSKSLSSFVLATVFTF